ncbi:MAG TPA: hypothetical protein PLO89_04760 [Spirochaetota bacterium]|nr:hypothetical protein [Spirochaetota bacterium]
MKIDKEKYVWIEYIFDFDEPKIDKKFMVLLDKKTIIAVPPENSGENGEFENWTELDFHKCEICPLSKDKTKYCPIAYNISGLAKEFSEIYSIEQVNITVNTEERTYYKRDSVQQGLRSILGIYLATSGCPHMEILKPMARFHLPFASMEETIYRQISNYLLSQYFEFIDGKIPDLVLKEFEKKNELVNMVNQGICNRIDYVTEADANKNALIILNAVNLMLNIELQTKLDSLKYLFKSS